MASCYRQCAALAAFIFILMSVSPAMHAQSWQWVQIGSGSANDIAGGMALDTLGNAYVTGTFEQNIAFNATIFTNGTATGLYIAKYNALGLLQWAVQGIGGGNFLNSAIAVGKGGEVFLTGTYIGTVRIGTDTLRAVGGSTEAFVARFNPDGSRRWIRRAAVGPGNAYSMGIAVDNVLGCYITGYFADTATFDTSGRRSVGGNDVFVAKYDRNGVIQWTASAGGAGDDRGYGIGVDATANSYITGRFTDSAFFAVDTVISLGGTDVLSAKFSPLGAPTWAASMGGVGDDEGLAIAVDAFGSSHITGSFNDTASFDTVRISSAGARDAFVAKVDGVGTLRWARRAGGEGDDAGHGIAIDDVGSVYATGYATDSANFGNVVLPIVPNNADVFVVRYDGAGTFGWVRTAGGTGRDEGRAVAVDRGNELRVAGMFSDTARFDVLNRTAAGALDLFVGKLGADPTITLGLFLEDRFCVGDEFPVPFTVKGIFANGNYYIAQLSDSAGSFAQPVELGRVFGIGGTTIVAKIPDTTYAGSRYRVRVVSTNPVVASPPNDKDLQIAQRPNPVVEPAGPVKICRGDSVILDAGAGFTTYVWNNGERTRRIVVKATGEFAVTVTNGRGCAATSERVRVDAVTAAKPVITRTDSALVCTPAVSYQWDFNGAPISGATGQSLNPSGEGLYRVTIVDSNGCRATSDVFNYRLSGVSLVRSLDGVAVYPHPNKGLFSVRFAVRAARVTITLTNTAGRQVAGFAYDHAGGDFVREVDITSSPAGVYFLRVECGDRSWTGQVVKQ